MAISFVFIKVLKKIVLTKNITLEIYSVASAESQGKLMKYIGFPWPLVLATHDHKRLVPALLSSRSYWL
jgi:hypothetical protein